MGSLGWRTGAAASTRELAGMDAKKIIIEVEQDAGGRWSARAAGLADTPAYGPTEGEAVSRATALALRSLADEIERGGVAPREVLVPFKRRDAKGEGRRLSELLGEIGTPARRARFAAHIAAEPFPHFSASDRPGTS